MKLKFGSGAIRLDMDDTLERMMRAAAERVAPGVLDRIDTAVTRIEAEATRRWPVKTGKSRDGLASHTIITPDGDHIRGTVMNDVFYARYVKSFKNSLNGKSAMVTLLMKPIQAEAKLLAEDLGKIATKAIKS